MTAKIESALVLEGIVARVSFVSATKRLCSHWTISGAPEGSEQVAAEVIRSLGYDVAVWGSRVLIELGTRS